MQTRYRLASMTKNERHAEYNAILNAIPHYWPAEKKTIISELINYAKLHADSDPVLTNISKASHEKYLTKFFSNQAKNAVTLARCDAIQTILDARYLPTSIFLYVTIDAIKSKTELHSRLRETVLTRAEAFLKSNLDEDQSNLFLTGMAATMLGLFAMGLDFNSYSAGLVLLVAGTMLMLFNQQLTYGEMAVSHNRFNELPKPDSGQDMTHLHTGSLYDSATNLMGNVRRIVRHQVDEKLNQIESDRNGLAPAR